MHGDEAKPLAEEQKPLQPFSTRVMIAAPCSRIRTATTQHCIMAIASGQGGPREAAEGLLGTVVRADDNSFRYQTQVNADGIERPLGLLRQRKKS